MDHGHNERDYLVPVIISCVIWEHKIINSDIVSTVSPSISHEVMGPDAMILFFWMLSFKPTFSLSSFTFIKRLFNSSSLSAVRVVPSVRTGRGTTDCFQIGNGVRQGCILSPCLFNLYAECIMQNARLDEAQVGIKVTRRNINNLRYADDTTCMAEREEE